MLEGGAGAGDPHPQHLGVVRLLPGGEDIARLAGLAGLLVTRSCPPDASEAEVIAAVREEALVTRAELVPSEQVGPPTMEIVPGPSPPMPADTHTDADLPTSQSDSDAHADSTHLTTCGLRLDGVEYQSVREGACFPISVAESLPTDAEPSQGWLPQLPDRRWHWVLAELWLQGRPYYSLHNSALLRVAEWEAAKREEEELVQVLGVFRRVTRPAGTPGLKPAGRPGDQTSPMPPPFQTGPSTFGQPHASGAPMMPGRTYEK